jgi:microcin C transport system substrate-binding protein
MVQLQWLKTRLEAGLKQAGAASLAALLACVMLSPSASAADVRVHALSLVEKVKFGPDFKHFDWVNPDAPKGGVVRLWAMGTFDSLNEFSIKGNAAADLGLIYDSLMMSSSDEQSTTYCLVCEWVSFPADYSSVTFGLRKEAKFHDGKPITPEDVIFSMEALKKANPKQAGYYANVVKGEKTGEREVTFTFDAKGNRELPQIVGELQVLPRHYWTANGANGQPRDLAGSSLEVPLGSGPYKVKAVDAGRMISYERVADWWAKDLPVSRGLWNFDEIRYTYYRERVPAFEAFKSGQIDFWRENSAKFWATGYDFDALKQGLVKKERIDTKNVAPMQALTFNTRRKQFQDPRVRQAFNYAFDFEFANKNLFFDQYERVGSYFGNSELQATGLPQGRELEILKEIEKDVPPQVFTTEWKNPVNTSPEEARKNLGEAAKLLAAAGYTAKGGVLANAKGEPLTVEFLIQSPDFERVLLPMKTNLEKLGVKATIRNVDSSQYQARERVFDFDVVVHVFGQSISPGNEQRFYWGSEGADKPGGANLIGIKSPAMDKLIDKVVFAPNRAELVAATKALDRVLLWNHFVVPQWHAPYDRVATWNMFGRPAKLPSRTPAFRQVWWYDAALAKALPGTRGQ